MVIFILLKYHFDWLKKIYYEWTTMKTERLAVPQLIVQVRTVRISAMTAVVEMEKIKFGNMFKWQSLQDLLID